MLVIKIELWPGGVEKKARPLGEVHIANDGSGTLDEGDYNVTLFKSPEYAKSPGVWKRGRVRGFPRKRLGPYDLLFRALRACVASRNREEKADKAPTPPPSKHSDGHPF